MAHLSLFYISQTNNYFMETYLYTLVLSVVLWFCQIWIFVSEYCLLVIDHHSFGCCRLGGGEDDVREIMRHPFFACINWHDLEEKKVTIFFFDFNERLAVWSANANILDMFEWESCWQWCCTVNSCLERPLSTVVDVCGFTYSPLLYSTNIHCNLIITPVV